ncbi:hypothetical protein EYD45_06915 [Hyunsoonleella flava]|uniref:Host attachment protein n=1 Tax=Hyunsoonleella flava TaxID=2527939 RepID=A0A4Q9FGP7_9FLAO|nr:hypothetical protein [Hyunsoonleella flava]TBN04344.1 hypothetical protein EYD45_06915 [Hyunsoonleella flava]
MLFKQKKTKRTGIWLDKKKAIVVRLINGETSMNTITSNIESFRPHGGSGTRFKGGPQDVLQDSKYLEREKNQLRDYFKNLASEIRDSDDIILFGPAETAEKFYKELTLNYKDLSSKVKDVVKADSMTNNQVIAWVKAFYKIKDDKTG